MSSTLSSAYHEECLLASLTTEQNFGILSQLQIFTSQPGHIVNKFSQILIKLYMAGSLHCMKHIYNYTYVMMTLCNQLIERESKGDRERNRFLISIGYSPSNARYNRYLADIHLLDIWFGISGGYWNVGFSLIISTCQISSGYSGFILQISTTRITVFVIKLILWGLKTQKARLLLYHY